MTLVVVDMQEEFFTYKSCLESVIDIIELAKKRKEHIALLEYDNCGPTTPFILLRLAGYPFFQRVTKYQDGGSLELIAAFQKWNEEIDKDDIAIAGINTCFCIIETAQGLKHQLPDSKIRIHLKEVACTCPSKPWRNRPNQIDCYNLLPEIFKG